MVMGKKMMVTKKKSQMKTRIQEKMKNKQMRVSMEKRTSKIIKGLLKIQTIKRLLNHKIK